MSDARKCICNGSLRELKYLFDDVDSLFLAYSKALQENAKLKCRLDLEDRLKEAEHRAIDIMLETLNRRE